MFPRFKLERFHLAELCFSRDSAAVRILIWYSIDTPTLNIEQASMVILRLLFFGFPVSSQYCEWKKWLSKYVNETYFLYIFYQRIPNKCICTFNLASHKSRLDFISKMEFTQHYTKTLLLPSKIMPFDVNHYY